MAVIPRTQGRTIEGRAMPIGGLLSDATARAWSGIGSTLRQTGTDMMAQETRQRLAEFEQQKQVQEAAARQQDVLQLQGTQQRLRELHDEIGEQVGSGAIPAAEAENVWRERSGKLTAEGLGAVREVSRTGAQTQLVQLDGTLSRSLGRLVVKRQQSEIGAGLGQSLEQWQRDYLQDPSKGAAISGKVMETLQTLGPTAGWSPEKIATTAQQWKERTQYTQAHTALSAGRNDPAALAQAEKMIGTLPDLDPLKRSELLDRAQVYRLQHQQRAESAQRMAQMRRDAQVRDAEAAFNAGTRLADYGTLNVDEAEGLAKRMAGTPYQQAFTQLIEQQRKSGPIAAQPVAAIAAGLRNIDAKIATGGVTAADLEARARLAKVQDGQQRDIKELGGMDALAKRMPGFVVSPLNLAGGLQGLATGLRERSAQAQMASEWTGQPESPLRPAEAQTVAQLLSGMPADQKATGLQLLASQMTPQQAQALAMQIRSGEKDVATSLALAYGASQTTQGRPTSELILKGEEALKSKAVKIDDAAEIGLTARFTKELGGAIPNPEQSGMVMDAARLIWAAKRAEGQPISEAGAIRLAVGGEIADRNGSKVVIPSGVTESAFEQHLEKYPAQALQAQLSDGKVYVRGQPVEAAAFLASLPGAPLRTVGRGRYAVLAGGAVATNANGRPIIVEAPGAR